MGRPSDDEQLQRFLGTLRALGGAAGNVALRNQLQWTEDEYWRLREKLIESGQIIRGKGRGGSVAIVEETRALEPVIAQAEAKPINNEADLYAPCLEVLKAKWSQERGLRDVHIEITASQGSKRTGGVWTRPDVTAISMRTFTHWPGRIFDIWTFEIKPSWQFNVTGIFEAAAHARASTHSYVLFQTPPGFDEADGEISLDVARLISESQRLGVGMVLFEKAEAFETWDFKVDPVRRQPDPALLEEFVVTQLSNEAKNHLLRWGK